MWIRPKRALEWTDIFWHDTHVHTDDTEFAHVQGGSNMTGTDLYVNKPHCAAAVRP